MKHHRLLTVILLFVLLAGCGATPTPTSAPPTSAPPATSAQASTAAPATKVPATATAPAPTATAGPTVGGKLVWAVTTEPPSLDEAAYGGGQIFPLLGGTLVGRNPKGDIVPYLAQSWTISSNGLTYDFKLRKDVRFHDGTPLTAQDFAWTIQRYLDPASLVAWAGFCLTGVTGAEALDDATLRLTLSEPQYYLLLSLSLEGFVQPQSKAAVTKPGIDYGRHPVGVGPYKFKEWQTGDRIVLQRNPDFAWGPTYTHGGAPYIETVEFRFLPENATVMAGLEALEVDYATLFELNLDRVRATGKFEVTKTPLTGIPQVFLMNVSRPPFDDLRVRQAFSYALDRDILVKVLGETGDPVNTPLTSNTPGYWAGSKQLGYAYDLAKAKAIMKDAGYLPGSDGLLQKDGKPLVLDFLVDPSIVQVSLAIQEQLKAFGVKGELRQTDMGSAWADMMAGNYDATVTCMNIPSAAVLYAFYDSAAIGGGLNLGHVNNPELDRLLRTIVSATDAKVNQQAADDAQRIVAEQVYNVPLYAIVSICALSTRVVGFTLDSQTGNLQLYDAYIKNVK